jgi:hypothetical protein
VRVEGRWYEGSFSRQWFGWNFDDFGTSGIQLNLLDEVFEIVTAPSKRARRPARPDPQKRRDA